MAIIRRGQEPANIKKRLDTLFPKLNEAYPDKVIRSLAKDHKKWAETVTELYRALGYPDSESFLKAYGYTVERGSQGRPSGDHMAIIDELKKRYPNGTSFEKMDELKAANPDLAGKFKTLSNRSKELFGMTLADYFKSIGLLGGSDHKKQLDELLTELKRRYPAGSTLPATLAQLKEDNADLMVSRINYTKEIYGVNPQDYLSKEGLLQSEQNIETTKLKKSIIAKAQQDFARHMDFDRRELQKIEEKLAKKNETDAYVITINKVRYWSDTPVCRGQVVKVPGFEGEKCVPVESYSIMSWQSLKEGYTVMFPDEIIDIVDDSNGLRIADNMLVKSFVQDEEVVVPDGIEVICKNAFLSNPHIKKVRLPESLIAIEDEAFKGCVGLREVNLPTALERIGNNVFENCISLERAIVPAEADVGENVFENCFSLQETEPAEPENPFTIEDTKPFVPSKKFSTPEIEFDDKKVIASAVFRGLDHDIEKARKTLSNKPKKKVVAAGVSEFVLYDENDILLVLKKFPNLKAAMFVEEWYLGFVNTAYSRSGYPHITDNNFAGYCDFHDESRWDWEHLPTESEFSSSTTFISTGDYAEIDYIFVMESDWNAMNYVVCVNGELRQVVPTKQMEAPEFVVEKTGPKQGKIVGYNGSATHLVLPETYGGKRITEIDLQMKSQNLSRIESLTVPEGYRSIGGFANSAFLKKVTLPRSLLTIQARAFLRCKNLEEVVMHDDVFYIYDEAFAECPKLKRFCLPARLQGGCLERESGGIDGRVGRWLFRKSGIRELLVNSASIDPYETDCLQGCKDYVIYAVPGSPFFKDDQYGEYTKEYTAAPLVELYGIVSQNGIANDGNDLQINLLQNTITSIPAFIKVTKSGEQEEWVNLSFVVEGNCINIFDCQHNRMGTIHYRKDIAALMSTNAGQIINFRLHWSKNQMQACHEAIGSFDIALSKPKVSTQARTASVISASSSLSTLVEETSSNNQKTDNAISKTFVVNRRKGTTRVHIIVAKDENTNKFDWLELERLFKKAALDNDAIEAIITRVISLLSDDCFIIADNTSMLSDEMGLSAGWFYNRKCLFDDFPMGGNDDGVYPTDIDIEDVNTWVNEFIRQRLFVGTAEEYFRPLLDAPYLRGIFTEADLLNYQTFTESLETFEIVDDSVSENDVEQVEEAAVSVDEELQLAANALQVEADRKRQEDAAAQARALEIVCKAAEEEKQRREAEERKRLEEEEFKRKEAEEQKQREEEERKQKEVEARRIAEEKYQTDLKVWEQTCKDIQKQREQTVADRLSAAKVTFEQAAQKDYDTAVSVATDRKKTAQQNKADAELRLSKLGLFNFAEKNAMKEAVAKAEAEIIAADKDLEQAKQNLNTMLAAIPAKISAQEPAIRESVEEELAFPAKPADPNV